MINPRSSSDPQLKAALQAWDSANSSWDDAFDQAMRIRDALRDSSSHSAFGWATLTAGRITACRGDVNFAESLLSEAVGRFYLAGEIYGKEMAISQLAIPQAARRNLDRALEFALTPLASNVPFSDHDRSLLHNTAAMCYWAREESHHAIAHLIKEFELIKNSGELERNSMVLGNMGVVLLGLGEWDLALSVSTKAWRLQLANCNDQRSLQLAQLANMVFLETLLKDHSAALAHAEELLVRSNTSSSAEPSVFLVMLVAFSASGKIEQGRTCLDRARALTANNLTPFSSAHLQVGEAHLLESTKEYQSAIRLATRVLDQPVDTVKRSAHMCAALVLARCYNALRNASEATKWQRLANEIRYESPLSNILSTQLRASLKVEQPADPLTERELTCLTLAAHGQTSADIGLKLDITTRTVNFHFAKILRKLNAANRQEAIAKAVGANLLQNP